MNKSNAFDAIKYFTGVRNSESGRVNPRAKYYDVERNAVSTQYHDEIVKELATIRGTINMLKKAIDGETFWYNAKRHSVSVGDTVPNIGKSEDWQFINTEDQFESATADLIEYRNKRQELANWTANNNSQLVAYPEKNKRGRSASGKVQERAVTYRLFDTNGNPVSVPIGTVFTTKIVVNGEEIEVKFTPVTRKEKTDKSVEKTDLQIAEQIANGNF